jgi:hypothetical protein
MRKGGIRQETGAAALYSASLPFAWLHCKALN